MQTDYEVRAIAVDESRLDRFEQRLDRLAEAFATLARMEERMLNSNHKLERLETLLASQSVRVDELTKQLSSVSTSNRITEKSFWLLLGSVVAYGFTVLSVL
jgi:predicted RNase H-like nuclease (RuvC/YqgF family)